MSKPIRYSIRAASPEAHRYEVSCLVADPDPDGQEFALPAWIPGSYMIREFARHVVAIRAASGGRKVAIEKVDKHSWRAGPTRGAPLAVTIEVYAFDLSVRGAYLDTTRGFFNGPCVFLRPIGKAGRACEVEIVAPRGARYRDWRVATALKRVDARPYGFGTYCAGDYDELIDSPVELGPFTLATFRSGGVPHDIAIAGRHDADMERLARDCKRICDTQLALFGKPPALSPARDRYVFLVNALGEGYGGLEHRASTALVCARDELPRAGERGVAEAYRGFLGLVSHEYFHTWNVKRIKPAAFTPYDLDRENYTRLLWAFEGFTSYYDDLTLVRAGLVSIEDYLGMLAKSITALARTPGRQLQSIAESSFDAWIKYYRQDENTPNAVVSYYGKGSLVALALDLTLRAKTRGRRSLDDLMRLAWQRYGALGVGVPEDGIETLARELAGTSLASFFESAVYGTDELPLAPLFAGVGVRLTMRAANGAEDRGGFARGARAAAAAEPRVDPGWRLAAGDTKLSHVLTGGAAEAAGLAAGDTIVAVDGLRASAKSLPRLLGRRRAGETVRLHVFRRDELFDTVLALRAGAADTCDLRLAGSAPSPALRRWLRPPRVR
jgi:predicted metalloprotease with PDZ domain